jgi:hypothetical protein
VKILDRLFGKAEEINGRERCPTHLYRWTLLKRRNWSVYLHHFVGDDWSRDLHDHPGRFISIGLWGRYREETPAIDDGGAACSTYRLFHAPWIRSFPATHIHRLQLIDAKPCWTLVIVLKATRPWGFWHNGNFIGWRDYLNSETADRMKACE